MCVCLVPLDQEVVVKCRGIGQTIVANQGRVTLNIATGTFFLKQAMRIRRDIEKETQTPGWVASR